MGGILLWLLLGFSTFIEGSQIENARAIVTGGANGIGYHCVHDLLARGAQAVVILDIDVINGTLAAQRFGDEFGVDRVFFFATDVSDAFQFEMGFWTAVQFLGGLDIMINDAGFLDDSIWDAEIDTNIKGVIHGTLMSIDLMGKHKGGRGGTVINMGSIASFTFDRPTPVYDATKRAVLGFSTAVSMSYNVTGVAVKTMCPGGTNTRLMTSTAFRFLDFVDYDDAIETIQSMPLQEIDVVSGEIMRLIEEAPNGAIWVVEKDEPTISINIPNYREWGTPV